MVTDETFYHTFLSTHFSFPRRTVILKWCLYQSVKKIPLLPDNKPSAFYSILYRFTIFLPPTFLLAHVGTYHLQNTYTQGKAKTCNPDTILKDTAVSTNIQHTYIRHFSASHLDYSSVLMLHAKCRLLRMTVARHSAHHLFNKIFISLNTVFCTPHKRKRIWATEAAVSPTSVGNDE